MLRDVQIFYHTNIFFGFNTIDSGIYKKIRKRYSFEISRFQVKGYSGSREPEICLIQNQRYLYYGLLNDFVMFLQEIGASFSIDERLLQESIVDERKFDLFVEKLNLLYKLRPYQRKAILETYKDKTGVLLSPTSSGKSLMIFILSLMHISRCDSKVVIIVPSKGLVDQMYNDFLEYTSTNTYINISTFIRKIHSEIEIKDIPNEKIVISTWQSLVHRVDMMKEFGMLIYDECQLSQSPEGRKLIEASVNAEYRIGTTGTMHGDDDLADATITGLFGEAIVSASARELIDMGYMADLDIYGIILSYDRQSQRLSYVEENEFIQNDERRFEKIISMVEGFKMNSLLLFKTIMYGQKFYERLKRNGNKRVFYIDGTIPSTSKKELDRQKIRKMMEMEDNSVLVASYGTCSTGFSVKNIHNVIMAESMKKRLRVIQAIGRGLRLNDNKDKVKIIDVVDKLVYPDYFNQYGYGFEHYLKRKTYYEEQQFPLKEFSFRM